MKTTIKKTKTLLIHFSILFEFDIISFINVPHPLMHPFRYTIHQSTYKCATPNLYEPFHPYPYKFKFEEFKTYIQYNCVRKSDVYFSQYNKSKCVVLKKQNQKSESKFLFSSHPALIIKIYLINNKNLRRQ